MSERESELTYTRCDEDNSFNSLRQEAVADCFGNTQNRVKENADTYCNPMNLDYAFVPKKDYSLNNAHRSSADPSCQLLDGKLYLFSTNQEGYWVSENMGKWDFIPHLFKSNFNEDQVCAPGAWAGKNGMFLLPSFTDQVSMPLYQSKDPSTGVWTEAAKAFPLPVWDPSLFEDEDGKTYVYWGSSNLYPLKGVELDPANQFAIKGQIQELLRLHTQIHGWERFGDDNQNGKLDPFIEGPWMSKFKGRYYLQYAAPGTELNVYGDGVYTADSPLGPFKYQAHNPFSWKPTGFITGAGHGSTFADKHGNLWHVGSSVISQKNTFERRLSMFPTYVDGEGVLHTDTSFGDYPHKLAVEKREEDSGYTGWTLLSYNKKAWASESKENKDTAHAFDENIKTYWSAPNNKEGQFLAVDLGKDCDVRAIQVNYADDEARLFGKQHGLSHRYQILESKDKSVWNLLVDKSKNDKEVPHDYIELVEPVSTRYLKLVNLEMPTGNFAIGDLRVFGQAPGPVPEAVSDFKVERNAADRRDAVLNWQAVDGAYAYEIAFGVEPEKLYSSLLVHDTKYNLHSLNVDSSYYFRIKAVSETGISKPSTVISIR
ncbi:MAG: family 43 glycosylhydrolase [Candidatus Obscuribacterales bacterium]|nr:family 43 glycosylhydrolase [Candidatus Obscuribacterales bacterium]